MARLPYLDADDLDPDDRFLLDRPVNLARMTAHSVGGAKAFNRMGAWIRFKSTLDPRLREMAILRIGVITQTDYEYSHHIVIGRQFGLTDDDIRNVIDGPTAAGLSELERLILSAADEATHDLEVSEATFEALSQHFDAELLTELTMIIAYYNAVVRLLRTLGIDVEPGTDYAAALDEFPLPQTP